VVKNIFAAIPEHLDAEIFERLAESDNVKIERIISKGHTSPASGWYDQQQNEWVVLLKGEAVLTFPETPSITLKPGDYLTIPAHTKHRVDWTDPNRETVWLSVHY